MNPTPRPTPKAIFLDAIERPAHQRDAFVRGACDGDESLERAVHELLRAYRDADRFMAEPTAPLPSPSDQASPNDRGSVDHAWLLRPGSRIDRYTIEARLGEGGMGAVYLATQTEPFNREVALKVVKPGMGSRAVIQRFEAERQALALMEHPGIARVFDAGTTSAGLPYFVMEHVEGRPITAFADEHVLAVRDRLLLFERVCLAVQHAHQKGLIHRDLKPSNVLVTLVDGVPQPKVIDFGIAKAITGHELEPDADGGALTREHEFIGTPQYMAPEQAAGGGRDIDTRADVYALGVILYELLSGHTPFDPARLASAGHAELIRVITDEEPPRPSELLRRDQARAAAIARSRATEPERLSRVLADDLDWIVLRSMEKDRDRRYPAVSALAAEIGRFLRHEPLEAGPPTTGYRLAKFARRHRAAITAGGMVAGALILGLVLAVVGLVEARRQQQIAASNLADAETITGFLTGILEQADPARLGRNVTVAAVLDRAAASLDTSFAGRPLIEARVRHTVGDTYLRLGRYDAAERHARRALVLAREHLPTSDPRRLRAALALGNALVRLDRREEARLIIDEALGLASVVEPVAGRDTLRVLKLDGDLAELSGDLVRAESISRRVVEGRRSALGSSDPETLIAVNDLANVLMEQGRVDEAQQLYDETLRVRRESLGPDHPDTISSINNLAEVYLTRREPERAEALYREAIERGGRTLGPDHPDQIASLTNLATALAWQDRDEEAEAILSDALAIMRRTLGPEHRQTLAVMHNLGAINGYLGRRDKERELKTEVLEIRRRINGPDHLDTVASEMTLARLHATLGEHQQAVDLLQHVMRVYRASVVPQDQRRVEAAGMMVESLIELGRVEEARSFSLERREGKRISADDPDASLDQIWFYAEDLIHCELPDLADPARAEPYLRRAIALAPSPDPRFHEWLAISLEASGDIPGAIAELDRAIAAVDRESEDAMRMREMRRRLAPGG